MALAILSFSAYARRDEGSYELENNCTEADYDLGLCEEGRRLRYIDDDNEADFCAAKGMMWDADEGECIDGRRLVDGSRRLRGDEEGVEEKPEGDDCTEEDGCEGHRLLEKWSDRDNKENTIPEESEDDGERRLAGASTDDGKCRRKGKRCLDDEEASEEDEWDYEREEDHGDAQHDHDGNRRLNDS